MSTVGSPAERTVYCGNNGNVNFRPDDIKGNLGLCWRKGFAVGRSSADHVTQNIEVQQNRDELKRWTEHNWEPMAQATLLPLHCKGLVGGPVDGNRRMADPHACFRNGFGVGKGSRLRQYAATEAAADAAAAAVEEAADEEAADEEAADAAAAAAADADADADAGDGGLGDGGIGTSQVHRDKLWIEQTMVKARLSRFRKTGGDTLRPRTVLRIVPARQARNIFTADSDYEDAPTAISLGVAPTTTRRSRRRPSSSSSTLARRTPRRSASSSSTTRDPSSSAPRGRPRSRSSSTVQGRFDFGLNENIFSDEHMPLRKERGKQGPCPQGTELVTCVEPTYASALARSLHEASIRNTSCRGPGRSALMFFRNLMHIRDCCRELRTPAPGEVGRFMLFNPYLIHKYRDEIAERILICIPGRNRTKCSPITNVTTPKQRVTYIKSFAAVLRYIRGFSWTYNYFSDLVEHTDKSANYKEEHHLPSADQKNSWYSWLALERAGDREWPGGPDPIPPRQWERILDRAIYSVHVRTRSPRRREDWPAVVIDRKRTQDQLANIRSYLRKMNSAEPLLPRVVVEAFFEDLKLMFTSPVVDKAKTNYLVMDKDTPVAVIFFCFKTKNTYGFQILPFWPTLQKFHRDMRPLYSKARHGDYLFRSARVRLASTEPAEYRFTPEVFSARLVNIMKDLTGKPKINNNLLRHMLITWIHECGPTKGMVVYINPYIEQLAYKMGHSFAMHFRYILNHSQPAPSKRFLRSNFYSVANKIADTNTRRMIDSDIARRLPHNGPPRLTDAEKLTWSNHSALNDDDQAYVPESDGSL